MLEGSYRSLTALEHEEVYIQPSMAPIVVFPSNLSLLEYAALFSQIIATFLALITIVLCWLYRPLKPNGPTGPSIRTWIVEVGPVV